MKKIILTILIVMLCGCSTTAKQETLSIEGMVVLVDDNGNADIDVTNTDILAKGFNYGDSVNIKLENGYVLEDVPFLSGMYVEYGKAMLYGKASKDKVSIIQKYKSFAQNSEAIEEMAYTITLNQANKYINIEEVGNLVITNNIEDYEDIEVFSNFREVRVGDIKEGRLYRSASPIDNSTNRSDYVCKLALDKNIRTILNAIDKEDAYNELLENLQRDAKTLIENVAVINAPISNDYQSEKNNNIMVHGLIELTNNEYPYLMHCLEGKDRVGYELAIIESLCNATYEEIVDDYMLSYKNYYGVTKDSQPEKYDYIKQTNIDAMLKFIAGVENIQEIDLKEATVKFLINHGMNNEQINALIQTLCK